jgi:hypothetical protein
LNEWTPLRVVPDVLASESRRDESDEQATGLIPGRDAPSKSRREVEALTAILIYLAKSVAWKRFDVIVVLGSIEDDTREFRELVDLRLPVSVEIDRRDSFEAITRAVTASLDNCRRRGAYAADLFLRTEERLKSTDAKRRDVGVAGAGVVALCFGLSPEARARPLIGDGACIIEIEADESSQMVKCRVDGIMRRVGATLIAEVQKIAELGVGDSDRTAETIVDTQIPNNVPVCLFEI